MTCDSIGIAVSYPLQHKAQLRNWDWSCPWLHPLLAVKHCWFCKQLSKPDSIFQDNSYFDSRNSQGELRVMVGISHLVANVKPPSFIRLTWLTTIALVMADVNANCIESCEQFWPWRGPAISEQYSPVLYEMYGLRKLCSEISKLCGLHVVQAQCLNILYTCSPCRRLWLTQRPLDMYHQQLPKLPALKGSRDMFQNMWFFHGQQISAKEQHFSVSSSFKTASRPASFITCWCKVNLAL